MIKMVDNNKDASSQYFLTIINTNPLPPLPTLPTPNNPIRFLQITPYAISLTAG